MGHGFNLQHDNDPKHSHEKLPWVTRRTRCPATDGLVPTGPFSQHHRVSLGIHGEIENTGTAKTGKLSRMPERNDEPSAFKCDQVYLGEVWKHMASVWHSANREICCDIEYNQTKHLLTVVDQCPILAQAQGVWWLEMSRVVGQMI